MRLALAACLAFVSALPARAASAAVPAAFPRSLESYADAGLSSLGEVLRHRMSADPLNLGTALIFLGAILHTFLARSFLHHAHVLEERHRASGRGGPPLLSRLFHYLGEVEVIFGIWVLPLAVLLWVRIGWGAFLRYVESGVSYHEPLFVVVIMMLSSTRPVLALAEGFMRAIAGLLGGGVGAWWLTLLTVGPILGSLITEPAAMTITASLLARQFYSRGPSPRFAYATLGLLFVNVSVGGVLTHFAAPPVLMVAGPWNWGTPFLLRHFGWIAVVGILMANALYGAVFRAELGRMGRGAGPSGEADAASGAVPAWVTLAHLLFMAWAVINAHHPVLLVGGLLFFLAFHAITREWQEPLQLKSPILVGFFLAGLVVHGGLQQWWIEPVLGRLGRTPLLFTAMGLTAFNDNAAITYLSTLVPSLTEALKQAVVAGAVVGGGLTVIANAPNPAGQAILGRFFGEGISPMGLLLGALAPTAILAACFLLLG